MPQSSFSLEKVVKHSTQDYIEPSKELYDWLSTQDPLILIKKIIGSDHTSNYFNEWIELYKKDLEDFVYKLDNKNRQKLMDIYKEEDAKFKEQFELISAAQEANNIAHIRNEEKERQYGPFIEGMTKAAKIASLMANKELTTRDMYFCMVALKMSRESYNHKRDNIVDMIAYISSYEEFMRQQNNN